MKLRRRFKYQTGLPCALACGFQQFCNTLAGREEKIKEEKVR